MALAIHTEHDRQRDQIRSLVEATASADPFLGMGDFVPPTEVEMLRERVACLEASRRRALEHLAPTKKATKAVLESKIECARDELAREWEG